MKQTVLSALVLLLSQLLHAQATVCSFKPPFLTIHFGKGGVPDVNREYLPQYERVEHPCPVDGSYSFINYTSDCFRGDWLTLNEDHTPGDVDGNMLVVNASPRSGVFLHTSAEGFKGGTTYEFGMWIMNVCRISDKCPFPLLPNITIQLQTASGRTFARLNTGDIPRLHAPHWTQHRAQFVMPAGETSLRIVMTDNTPGGCGNDFALDDISFRECVKTTPQVVRTPPQIIVEQKKQPPVAATAKKTAPPVNKVNRPEPVVTRAKAEPVTSKNATVNMEPAPVERKAVVLPSSPPALTRRENPLVKTLEVSKGEIKLDLYDNGEIDGDTVSIYHNNTLIVSRTRLSQRPITFRIPVDAASPHHELVMVAENLGSIPPNTSVLIVTAGDKRYQVFITSTEQKNAKVVLELKQ